MSQRLTWSLIFSATFGIVLAASGTWAGPLEQVIEGAKNERTVSVRLRSTLTAKSIERLRKEIKAKFGLDLDIKFTPSISMPKELAEATMEHKVGAVPSYDLMNFSSHVVEGMKTGVLDRVDWKPLITRDTNPEVVLEHPALQGALVYYTGHFGLMYNPEKVPSDKVPKTLAELADPKWKGKVGVDNYIESWGRWAFLLGKERVLPHLRMILKNGAIQGAYADLYNRFLIGEITLCRMSSIFLKEARDKGVPAAWQSQDFSEIREYSLVVRKGAAHSNAAKVVAVFLASPEGARFMVEESKSGNLHYPGNYEHDIRLQTKRQGIPEIFTDRKQEVLEYYSSAESAQWRKEVDLILKTAGER